MQQIPDEIKEYLSYDSSTGELTWLQKSACNINIGDVAGSIGGNGYTQVKFKYRKYSAHRVAWFLYTGKQPPDFIDHKNGNKSDNTWDNLREATCSQNQQNKGKPCTNISGYKGVSWYKKSNKWKAYITLDSKQYHLGLFGTPEEAYKAYCVAADKLHKQFANY